MSAAYETDEILRQILRIRIGLMKLCRVAGQEIHHGRTEDTGKQEETFRPGVRVGVQQRAHRIHAEAELVRPTNHAQIVI